MAQKKGTFADPALFTYKVILLVLAGVMIFGFVAYLVQYLNISIKHTVLEPPGAPGVLSSERYTFRYWLVFLAVIQGLLIFSALAATLFSGKSRFCSGLWFVFFILSVIAFIVFFVYLAREGTNCNEPDEGDNICNHPLRCCDPALNGNPASGCNGATTCDDPVPEFPGITPPITVAKLGWAPDFVWLFWTTLVFMVLDVAILVVVVCVTMWEPSMYPDDPLQSTFTTTGAFTVNPGMPLTSNAEEGLLASSIPSKQSSSIGARVAARRRQVGSQN